MKVKMGGRIGGRNGSQNGDRDGGQIVGRNGCTNLSSMHSEALGAPFN